MSSASKKQGTRVFKKGSPNGKITVYLGKRDFVDHVTHVDPIDGVVLVDPEYLKDRKVYGHVLAAFRYGREDLDVLGLTFRKDLYLASAQIYPPLEDSEVNKRPLTRLQERLVKKLGANSVVAFEDKHRRKRGAARCKNMLLESGPFVYTADIVAVGLVVR